MARKSSTSQPPTLDNSSVSEDSADNTVVYPVDDITSILLQQITQKFPATRKRSQHQTMALEIAEILIPAFAALLEARPPKCQNCEDIKAAARTCYYRADENEQYSRRESVRIFGIEEREGENLEETVQAISSSAGQPLDERDIVAIHRVGKVTPQKSRPIICRFTRRKPAKMLLTKQKAARNATNNHKMFIVEDLTPMRSKLRFTLKSTPGVDKIRVRDGRIFCEYNEKTVSIENPDHLFKVGIDAPNLKDFGLPATLT